MSELNISLRQLRDFVVLAEELNFRKAAERVCLSQPPLTRSIQALEVAVGVRLFDRTSRKVRLTEAGAIFLNDARSILKSVARARTLVSAETPKTKTLRLGYLEAAFYNIVPRILANFKNELPDVEIELVQTSSLAQETALLAGTLDLGIVRPPVDRPGLATAFLCHDELLMAYPECYGPEQSFAFLSEFKDHPFISYHSERNAGYHDFLNRTCARAGFVPKIAYQAASNALLMALVADGEGVALVSRHLASIPRAGVRFGRLKTDPPRGTLELIWRKNDPSAETQALLKHALEIAKYLQRSDVSCDAVS